MKKVLILLLLFISIILVGCSVKESGKYTTFLSVSNTKKDSFSMSYEKFDGYKTYTIKAEKDDNLHMTFTTEGGSIDCSIVDSNGNTVYQLSDVGELDNTIVLRLSGQYQITLTAHNHKGSFEFKWGK